MAIYLGTNQLSTGGGGAGGGGRAIPNIDTFTTSGTWTVPDTVKDKVSNDGYCEIGLLIVGGGSTTTTASNANTRSGEVINKVYKLTSADYDDPAASNPTVTVVVGATGGYSGIVSDGLEKYTQTNSGTFYAAPTFPQPYLTIVPEVSFEKNASNQILMASGDTTYFYNTTGSGFVASSISKSHTGFASGVTINTSTYSLGWVLTFNDQVPFDGVLTLTYQTSRPDYPNVSYTITHSWSTANQRFESSATANLNSQSAGTRYARVNFSRGANVGIKARAGQNTDFAEFQNNPYDPYGFNGFAKNATHNSLSNSRYSSSYYGSPGQGGYVEIYY